MKELIIILETLREKGPSRDRLSEQSKLSMLKSVPRRKDNVSVSRRILVFQSSHLGRLIHRRA